MSTAVLQPSADAFLLRRAWPALALLAVAALLAIFGPAGGRPARAPRRRDDPAGDTRHMAHGRQRADGPERIRVRRDHFGRA